MTQLTPEFILDSAQAFEEALLAKGYQIDQALRLVDLESRRWIDVSEPNFTATPTELLFFIDPDPTATPQSTGWAQITDEPNFKSKNSTDKGVAFGLIGHQWWLESAKVFGAAPTEVNSLLGCYSTADARIRQGSSIVTGPHKVSQALKGEPAARVSSATVAGEYLGGVKGNDNEYCLESTPILVEPVSTIEMLFRYNGAEFAARSPAVTEDHWVYWRTKAFVANVQKD